MDVAALPPPSNESPEDIITLRIMLENIPTHLIQLGKLPSSFCLRQREIGSMVERLVDLQATSLGT